MGEVSPDAMHEFRTRRRVEWSDTDTGGIIHFSRYFVFMETAEHQFLEALGIRVVLELDGRQIGWPRVAARCEYKRPARYDEELSVVDPQGDVVASTGDPDSLNLPEDWLDRVADGDEIQGPVYRDDDIGQVMMVIAVPIRAPDERLLGAFTAKVHFRTVDQSLRDVVIGETGHAYLLRDDGIVMVDNDKCTGRQLVAEGPDSADRDSPQGSPLLSSTRCSHRIVQPRGADAVVRWRSA